MKKQPKHSPVRGQDKRKLPSVRRPRRVEAGTSADEPPAALLEDKVRAMLKPWSAGIAREDYDFRPWVEEVGRLKDGREKAAHLMLGVFYEYARESEKLRGLLAVLNAKRRGLPNTDLAPRAFGGLDERTAELALGQMLSLLLCLSDELAENIPFGKVKPERIRKALLLPVKDAKGGLAHIPRQDSEYGANFRFVPGVAPAYEVFRNQATGHEKLLDWSSARSGYKSKYRVRLRQRAYLKDPKSKDCEEVMLLRVNWRNFTDEELGEAFTELLRRYRPTEIFPEPQRRGRGRETEWLRMLDNLAAMRLRRHFCKDEALRKFEHSAINFFGRSGQTVRAPKDWKNFKCDANRAEAIFAAHFQFGEVPANSSKGGDLRK